MRSIISKKCVDDLAIAGGDPAFINPLHVGRPNIGDRDSFMKRVDQIFAHRWLTNNGPMVQEFEARLANYIGVKHCIAMCNGTVGLEIAIRALGLKGEVIIPSFTFIATAHALQWQEITPVFADIDPKTHNIDPQSAEVMITPRTTGIIGVHLWGRPAPIDELQDIASRRGLKLMFDAAHALGCSYSGRQIGSFGHCEVFSFHATKILNTFEGGAVATNDDSLADKIRLMKNFGFQGHDNVIYPGTNGKMNEISAAMGLTNLENLSIYIDINKRNYCAYREALSNIDGIKILNYPMNERCNYQYLVVEVDQGFPVSRDELISILRAENILARRYFWPGCHNMEPYKSFYPHSGLMLPNTNNLSRRVIVLPTGMNIDVDDIGNIVGIIRIVAQDANSVRKYL